MDFILILIYLLGISLTINVTLLTVHIMNKEQKNEHASVTWAVGCVFTIRWQSTFVDCHFLYLLYNILWRMSRPIQIFVKIRESHIAIFGKV